MTEPMSSASSGPDPLPATSPAHHNPPNPQPGELDPQLQPALIDVESSRKAKLEHINTLEPAFVENIRRFQEAIQSICGSYVQYIEQARSNPNSPEFFPKQQALTQAIQEAAQLASEFGPDFNFKVDSADVNSLFEIEDQSAFSHFVFFTEQIINKIVNRKHYNLTALGFLERNYDRIIQHFVPQAAEGEKCQVELEEGKGDLHNGGKSAAKVIFKREGETVCSMYLKPRGAEIDRAVLEHFRKINELPADCKVLKNALPQYTILALEGYSLWENIPGESTENGSSVERYLNDTGRKAKRQHLVTHERLQELAAVLGSIHISDLSVSNVILQNDTTDGSIKIIPIDLENINEDQQTLLVNGRDPDIGRYLRGEGLELTRQFNKETVRPIPVRIVVRRTDTLMMLLGRYTNMKHACDGITQGIISQGYDLCVDRSAIERSWLIDSLNGDIPYFTRVGDDLHYGDSNGLLIARKQRS